MQILIPQLDPLTEQQLLGICNLQQSSEQAEEALAQGLHQLHQSLADTVAAGTLNDGAAAPNYMSLMAVALEKLASLESFYQQVTIFTPPHRSRHHSLPPALSSYSYCIMIGKHFLTQQSNTKRKSWVKLSSTVVLPCQNSTVTVAMELVLVQSSHRLQGLVLLSAWQANLLSES